MANNDATQLRSWVYIRGRCADKTKVGPNTVTLQYRPYKYSKPRDCGESRKKGLDWVILVVQPILDGVKCDQLIGKAGDCGSMTLHKSLVRSGSDRALGTQYEGDMSRCTFDPV